MSQSSRRGKSRTPGGQQPRSASGGRNKPPRDPHYAREAAKYANPVPSREFILSILEKSHGPMDHPALCKALSLGSADEAEALRRRLVAMCRDGQLVENRRGGFVPLQKADVLKGRVIGHREGFGFLRPERGGDDLYLNAREMRLVFDGDTALVRARETDKRGRTEATIVEVLERAHKQLVGRFFQEGDVGYVRPDSLRITQDILVPSPAQLGARHGQMVSVTIEQHPDHKRMAIGRITEVLGDHLDPGMEIQVAVRNHGIPWEWPDDVEAEAAAIPDTVQTKDKARRIDLRHLPLVTIDGEDARDFDDAVHCTPRKGGGWTLYVAIADVSHYVTPGSPLDREAELRATSVYFPGSVVPMLPEKLSNGLCSLNPHLDRLCMVCEMQVNRSGRVTAYRFYEAVMHSVARLTYTIVAAMLDNTHADHASLCASHAAVLPHVQQLHALFHAFRQARQARGAIDFETQETRILFSENRKIERIVPVVRNDAHKLIEECMLAANTCAAKLLEKSGLPALFRVHHGPSEEKLRTLRSFLGERRLDLGGGNDPTPADYQRLLHAVTDRDDVNLIQTMLLRSMSQAVYQPDNTGHFGLGYEEYAHFTSPIRRYPDLLVHRAIRYVIRNQPELKEVMPADKATKLPKTKIYPYDEKRMEGLGAHCSACERRADDASRDVVAWLKCEYLLEHVGRTFDGVIATVTSFGLFVELKDLYIEGLVHVTMLKRDYYHFDAAGQRLVGERTGETYRLGDVVTVRVIRVDLDDRKIDLELIATQRRASRKGKR